jgi:hypothetical protein
LGILKTIIAGSRDNVTYENVVSAMAECGWIPTQVISGNTRGVDIFGEQWAMENDIPLLIKPADWKMHGKAAGYIRNVDMANNADALVAIWDGESKGTKHMIDIALDKKLKVFVYNLKFLNTLNSNFSCIIDSNM